MLRSALDISVDVTKITSPGIYPIIQGNINVPDASAGLLTVSLTPSKPQITFQKENSSVVYSFVNGNWEKPTATDVDALAKSQNGADIPNKPLFVQNLGLKETLNPTKRVSIGSVGTGAFDGSTPCINIGDSDSGFIGSADGVIDIYCNNAKVGYIDNAGCTCSRALLLTVTLSCKTTQGNTSLSRMQTERPVCLSTRIKAVMVFTSTMVMTPPQNTFSTKTAVFTHHSQSVQAVVRNLLFRPMTIQH